MDKYILYIHVVVSHYDVMLFVDPIILAHDEFYKGLASSDRVLYRYSLLDTISSQFTLEDLERKSHTFKYSFKPLLQYAYNYKSSVHPHLDHSRPVSETYYNSNIDSF